MLAVKKNFKQGLVTLKITLLDDLWYLSHIISPGDLLTAKTERKLKIGDSSQGNVRVVRKTMTLKILVETVEFSDSGDQLRVNGLVQEGPDDVPKGVHHAFGLSLNDSCTLIKTEWPSFLRKKLDEAITNAAHKILFVLFDRKQALFALVRQQGIEYLADIHSDAEKKQYSTSSTDSIYELIVKQLEQYQKVYGVAGIVAASPAFWKTNLQKILPLSLKEKIVFITTNLVDKSSIPKLLNRPELSQLLADQRLQKEESFLAEVLEFLSKDMLAYGFADVQQAINIGAAAKVGVSENFVLSSRQKGTYTYLDKMLKQADKTQSEVSFLSSQEVCKTIDGLGGIVALLRWRQQ